MVRKFIAGLMDRFVYSLAWRLAREQARGVGSDPLTRMQTQIDEIRERLYMMDTFDHRHVVKYAHGEGARTSAAYWQANMQQALGSPVRDVVLFYGVDRAPAEGLWMEFGVWTGGSITGIANRRPDITIHGFDSFEGIPDAWAFNPKGTFSIDGKIPEAPANVKFHKGWFDDTVPRFFAEHTDKIAFMHIDCDMYSSTKTVFDHCWRQLQPGTIINFDEYWNYAGWEQHEFKAFQEMVAERGIKYEYLAFCSIGEMVCVRITEVPW